jgi:predicted CoA-binding protein
MNSIRLFFSNKNIAVVGVSKTGTGFGYNVYKQLKSAGHNVLPVNISTDNIEGNVCYNNLNDLKGKVDSVLLVIPPSESIKVVKEAIDGNIRNIWFQPGSESCEAVELCKKNGINVIEKQCFLMYSEPIASFHKFHRYFYKLAGKYPK